MINPQTGAITRTRTNRTTQYPWLSEDQYDLFYEYTGLDGEAHIINTIGGIDLARPVDNQKIGTPDRVRYDAAYGREFRQFVEPTTDTIYVGPDARWEDYLFQVIRRQYGNYLWDPIALMWRRQQDWFGIDRPQHMVQDEALIHPGEIIFGVHDFGDLFETTDDLVEYVFGNPDGPQDVTRSRHPTNEAEYLLPVAHGLFTYENQEYQHLENLYQTEQERFLRIAPEGTETAAWIHYGGILTRAWSKSLQTFYQRGGNEAYRIALQQQLENLTAVNNAIDNYGIDGDEIMNVLNTLQENPLPARVTFEIPAPARLATTDTRVFEPAGPGDEQYLTDLGAQEEFQQLGVKYAEDRLRQDYYTAIRDNPDIGFREATLQFDPGEKRFAKNFENIFNEAQEAYQLGNDLTLEVLHQPLQPGQEWDINTPIHEFDTQDWDDIIEIEADTHIGGVDPDVFTGPELNIEQPRAVFDVQPTAQTEELGEALATELLGMDLITAAEAVDMTLAEILGVTSTAVATGLFTLPYLITFIPTLEKVGHELFPTDEERQANADATLLQHTLLTQQANFENLAGRDAYVAIGGEWYRAQIVEAVQLNNYGYDRVNVATVFLPDLPDLVGVQRRFTVPMEMGTFILDDGNWTPQQIATWVPYTTPEAPYVDQRYVHPEHHEPETTEPDEPEITDPVERTPATTERTDPTVKQDLREGVGTYDPQRADPFAQQPPQEPETTVPEVMSYLYKEHNEVYTIWKNPNYTGTDPNRVERIFGGVVPFMSYNSEGHPILVNDQELDHHGHTEFNMVHISPIEMQEQATGQVNLENEATITQTTQNDEPTGEGNR